MKAKYYIYWNLHKDCWSVKYRGKVIKHTECLTAFGVEYRVSEKGRERVLREGRKNVHAYVVADEILYYFADEGVEDFGNATYNPYKGPHFVDVNGKYPIWRDAKARMYAVAGKPVVERCI